MNMKLVKYMLIAILVLGTGEVAAQVQVVSGKVTEMLGNQIEPIVGANVNIVNAQNRSVGGAVTNLDGDYRLQIPAQENNLTLVYSYIGMKTKRIKYTGQKVLNVKLESNVETLDEVAITAKRIERNNMGIGHKENVSATQKVMMEDLIATAPIATVEEALQGQLSGVDIALSADPGARSSIRIRGTSTLNGSVEPLIVIDGVPYTQELDDDFDFSTANEEDLGALLNIAPTDIESVEVLKDAAASAIYGARAANGVIVVKTKRGTPGKISISYNGYAGFQQATYLPEFVNAADYMQMVNVANANVGGAPIYSQEAIDATRSHSDLIKYPDTDWTDYMYQTGMIQSHSVSVSGGSNLARFALTANYLDNEALIDNAGYNRLNIRANTSVSLLDNLSVNMDFNSYRTNRHEPLQAGHLSCR